MARRRKERVWLDRLVGGHWVVGGQWGVCGVRLFVRMSLRTPLVKIRPGFWSFDYFVSSVF